jgi:3',5'-cyclic-AMP phosphodiesterase
MQGYHGQIKLIQLTDSHILADPEALLWNNLNTRKSMAAVLNELRQLPFPGDVVIISGDLAEKAEPEAYQWLLDHCHGLNLPVYCLPGNHDDPALMGKILNYANVSTRPLIILKNWQLILLNSAAPRQHRGYLDRTQLKFLNCSLTQRPDLNALIFLHHPPVRIGSSWMDTMGLDNAVEFFAILDQYPQVRGIIWGHIHQEFYAERRGVYLLGSPSTCVQFVPGSEHFQLEQLGPGYRELILSADGKIETHAYYLDCVANVSVGGRR